MGRGRGGAPRRRAAALPLLAALPLAALPLAAWSARGRGRAAAAFVQPPPLAGCGRLQATWRVVPSAQPLVALAPAPALAVSQASLDSDALVQVGLVLALVLAVFVFYAFGRPEQEEWQKEIDEVMTEKEYERGGDGPSICTKCGSVVFAYCPKCSGPSGGTGIPSSS